MQEPILPLALLAKFGYFMIVVRDEFFQGMAN